MSKFEIQVNDLITDQFHNKQLEAISFFLKQKPKMLLLYGSVRSGKTYVLIFIFLMMVALNKNRRKTYLISGNTKASIWRNIIMDMEKIIGRQISLDKKSCFQLFGNNILVLDGGQKGCNQKLRGVK